MNITIHSVIVSLFIIFPGLLTSYIQKALLKGVEPIKEWIPISILYSLIFNTVLFATIIIKPDMLLANLQNLPANAAFLDTPIADLEALKSHFTIYHAALYLVCLYSVAILYATVTGLVGRWLPSFAFVRGWTPISPFPDVWNDIFTGEFRTKENLRLRGKPEQLRPWLRVSTDSETQIIGMMRNSSVIVELDKPIEVFVNPVFTITKLSSGVHAEEILGDNNGKFVGMYLRIEPTYIVEIFSAQENWSPGSSGSSLAIDQL